MATEMAARIIDTPQRQEMAEIPTERANSTNSAARILDPTTVVSNANVNPASLPVRRATTTTGTCPSPSRITSNTGMTDPASTSTAEVVEPSTQSALRGCSHPETSKSIQPLPATHTPPKSDRNLPGAFSVQPSSVTTDLNQDNHDPVQDDTNGGEGRNQLVVGRDPVASVIDEDKLRQSIVHDFLESGRSEVALAVKVETETTPNPRHKCLFLSFAATLMVVAAIVIIIVVVVLGRTDTDTDTDATTTPTLIEWPNIEWGQMGPTLNGSNPFDEFGYAVALSRDGSTLVGGSPIHGSNMSGQVRVYRWNETNQVWDHLGHDLMGERDHDLLGVAVAASADGSIIAAGAQLNDGPNNKMNATGHVRVYRWTTTGANESSWEQLGNDIDGEYEYDVSGASLSLSDDGLTIAIGAVNNDGPFFEEWGVSGDSGHVRVYRWNGTSWKKLGNDIDGANPWLYFGFSVSLSADGSTVAVSATDEDPENTWPGSVSVFRWDGLSWDQIGDDMIGLSALRDFGWSVSLSSDGRTVAVGDPGNRFQKTSLGLVHVYQWDEADSSWNQLGSDIIGSMEGDGFGWSVSLASAGDAVAIGAPDSSLNGFAVGLVQVWRWNGREWIQTGRDIFAGIHDDCGHSVSLSGDGSTLAVGEPKRTKEIGVAWATIDCCTSNANFTNSGGEVRVFRAEESG